MAGRGLSTCQCGEQARTFSCQGSLDSFNWEQSLRPQTRSTGETGSRTLRCFLCSRRTELGQVGATCAASSAGWADWACEAALTACTSSLEPFIWVSGRLPPTREDEGVAYWFLTENQFNCLGVFQRPIHSLDKYFSNASVCQVRAWGFRGAPLRTLFLPLSGKRECWYVRRDLLSGGGIKHRPSRRRHWTQGALPGGSASGARWHLTLEVEGKDTGDVSAPINTSAPHSHSEVTERGRLVLLSGTALLPSFLPPVSPALFLLPAPLQPETVHISHLGSLICSCAQEAGKWKYLRSEKSSEIGCYTEVSWWLPWSLRPDPKPPRPVVVPLLHPPENTASSISQGLVLPTPWPPCATSDAS